jgi:hypothetical protein
MLPFIQFNSFSFFLSFFLVAGGGPLRLSKSVSYHLDIFSGAGFLTSNYFQFYTFGVNSADSDPHRSRKHSGYINLGTVPIAKPPKCAKGCSRRAGQAGGKREMGGGIRYSEPHVPPSNSERNSAIIPSRSLNRNT